MAKPRKKATEPPRETAPTRRIRPTGWGWRGPGGGRAAIVEAPAEYRGTSVQVCGLWPWSAGSGTPMIGVPLGRHLLTGATVCCDPISWFQRAKLINNPSMFVLGKPGLGKSTLIRRMALGLAGYGTVPMVLGDVRPDYVDLVEALGGQVIHIGRGRGTLNPLDCLDGRRAAARLPARERDALLAELHGRQLTMMQSLIAILRRQQPSDREDVILDQALRIMNDRITDREPLLGDLLSIVSDPPAELRDVALDRGDMDRYRDVTEHLEASLLGLTRPGRFGDIFAKPTSEPMRHNRGVVFDISSVDRHDQQISAAVLMACWNAGFAQVNIAGELAAAELEPARHYFIVMDELYLALRAAPGMVDRVDDLTRLNRQVGVGQAMCSHTMKDLMSLPREEDREKAKGFVERSGMIVCGGLPYGEMPLLRTATEITKSEEEELVRWATPATLDQVTGRPERAPGLGKFLLKVGTTPGIPIQVELTKAEANIHDTNWRWKELSRVGKAREA